MQQAMCTSMGHTTPVSAPSVENPQRRRPLRVSARRGILSAHRAYGGRVRRAPYLLILTCPLGGDSSAAIRRFERLDELTTAPSPAAACRRGRSALLASAPQGLVQRLELHWLSRAISSNFWAVPVPDQNGRGYRRACHPVIRALA